MKKGINKAEIDECQRLQLGDYFLSNSYLNKSMTEEKKAKENEFFLNLLYKPIKTKYYSEYFTSEFEQCIIQNVSRQKLKALLTTNLQMKYRKYIWKILLFDADFYSIYKYDDSKITENKHSHTIEKVL